MNKCDVVSGGGVSVQHHGFGRDGGECVSRTRGHLLLLSHRVPGPGDRASPRQPEPPLTHRRVFGVEPAERREFPAGRHRSLLLLCRTGRAGRCCAPEHEWSVRARWRLLSGAPSHTFPAHVPASALADNKAPHTHARVVLLPVFAHRFCRAVCQPLTDG